MSTTEVTKTQQKYCPICKKTITTNNELNTIKKSKCMELRLFFLSCCTGCMFCTNCLQNTEDFCPTCNTYLGE